MLFDKNKTVTRSLQKEYQRNIINKSQINTNKPGINYNVNMEDEVNIKTMKEIMRTNTINLQSKQQM